MVLGFTANERIDLWKTKLWFKINGLKSSSRNTTPIRFTLLKWSAERSSWWSLYGPSPDALWLYSVAQFSSINPTFKKRSILASTYSRRNESDSVRASFEPQNPYKPLSCRTYYIWQIFSRNCRKSSMILTTYIGWRVSSGLVDDFLPHRLSQSLSHRGDVIWVSSISKVALAKS